MEHEHVLSALTRKRAELAGEIRAIEKRYTRVTRDLEHLDNTLRLFDPDAKPETIKPRTKRQQPSRFGPGEMTRAVITVLRESEAPLTIREIAERLGEAMGLDMSTTKAASQVVANVRAALARPHDGLPGEKDGKEPMRYHVV
jgi:hypothetical protein